MARCPHLLPSRLAGLAVVAALVVLGAGCERLVGVTPAGALAAPPVSAQIAGLAASMSIEGKEVFYRARPKIVDRAELAQRCKEEEVGWLFGCYGLGRIYILRVTRPDLAGVMELIAAHEMLHAAYDELPRLEKARVDSEVEDLFRAADSPRLKESLAAYGTLTPRLRLNELHSIVGTEAAALGPALEDHYGRYFASRQRVVQASDHFRGLFEALERQIEGLAADVKRIGAELAALDARLAAENAALDALDRRLDAARDVLAYNRLLPERNELARRIRQGIERYNKLVADHNAKGDQIDALALEQDQLVEALAQKPPPSP